MYGLQHEGVRFTNDDTESNKFNKTAHKVKTKYSHFIGKLSYLPHDRDFSKII